MTGGEGCCLGLNMHRAAYTICARLAPTPHLSAGTAELHDYRCSHAYRVVVTDFRYNHLFFM